MVDLLTREKDVLALILGSDVDDAKALMDSEARTQVDAYTEAVERGAIETGARLKAIGDAAVAATGGDQKRIAMEFINIDTIPQRERGMIFQIIRGRDPTEIVLDLVRKNTGTGTKVAEVRYLIGNAKWDDFRDQSVAVDDD